MNITMENYKEPAENMQRFCKKGILENFSYYMKDFIDVINYTLNEINQQIDEGYIINQSGESEHDV